jgi:hypothetical protein
MYGIKFSHFIGDGDSSVYEKLKTAMPYCPEEIVKIECRNHILRNYITNIKEQIWMAKGRGKIGSIENRSLVRGCSHRLRNAIAGAVKHRSQLINEPITKRIEELRCDILNSPYHVFGDHSNCNKYGNYFCKGKDKDNNHVPIMMEEGIFQVIMKLVNRVSDNAASLIHNVDSNCVEHYNAHVAKFVGGKRINFSRKSSYKTRCLGAVIAHNTGRLHSKVRQKLPRKSPGKLVAAIECQREKKVMRSAKRRLFEKSNQPTTKKRKIGEYEYDSSGFTLVTDDAKTRFLQSLALDKQQIETLQHRTVTQGRAELWHIERTKRLTASNFGTVCKMRRTTDKFRAAYRLLKGLSNPVPAMVWGQNKEQVAIQDLETKINVKVIKCGFFVDPVHYFLGASPDGIIGEDTLVEVKCPSASRNYSSIIEAVTNKKCVHLQNLAGNLSLKKTHSYFYQIQGQLHIANKSKCYFVTWIPNDIHIEVIRRDETFWVTKMETFLIEFYKTNMLPLIVNDLDT